MRPTKNSDIHFVVIDRISYVCSFEIRFESLYGRTKIAQCTRKCSFSRELCAIFVLPYKDSNNRSFQRHTLEIHQLLQEYHGLCVAYNSRSMFSYSKSQHRIPKWKCDKLAHFLLNASSQIYPGDCGLRNRGKRLD